MPGVIIPPGLTQADLDAALALKADASALPLPSVATPAIEVTGGAAGTNQQKFAQEGHQHPRLTSTTYATLISDGTASVSFSRTFVNKPGVVMTEVDANGSQPLVCVVTGWQQDGQSRYTGCSIKGYRSQVMPTQNTSLSLATLLTGLITAVNTLAGLITGFNVFGGSASGATVSVIAVARSDVSAS